MRVFQSENKSYKKFYIIGGIVIIILILIFASLSTVPTGHVGIKTRFGAVQNDVITEGLNFKLPFIESIKKMDCRTQRVDIEGESASKDLQTVAAYIAINYRVNQEKAFELYKTVGMGYEEIIIKPATQESMKLTIAKYTAEELITKRAEVANTLQKNLTNKLETKGILVETTNIVNLNFSAAYDNAIEQKQVAEQEAKKAEQELVKSKVEAEKKVVEAQAEADAKLIKAKADAEAARVQKNELTKELIQLKWIEKWDGKLPTTSVSDTTGMIKIGE